MTFFTLIKFRNDGAGAQESADTSGTPVARTVAISVHSCAQCGRNCMTEGFQQECNGRAQPYLSFFLFPFACARKPVLFECTGNTSVQYCTAPSSEGVQSDSL